MSGSPCHLEVTTPAVEVKSLAEMVTDVGGEVMRDLEIPGELTHQILSFAIDVGPEDARWENDQMLSDAMTWPEASSFCRSTATRLFAIFQTEPIDAFEHTAPESLPDLARKKQVFVAAVRLAREVRAAVLSGSRAVYKAKYANHEFVVTVRGQRAELFQSFQFRYGVGTGIEYAKSLEDGDVEAYLANMARGGKVANDVQTEAFGYPLSPVLAGVFAYEKAGLASDDQIVQRVRERMRVTLTRYKEVSQRLGRQVAL